MKNPMQGFLTIASLLLAMSGMIALSYFGINHGGVNYFSFRNIKQGLDLKGGVYIVFEAENPTGDDMKKAESIIRLRLDSKGYMEAIVSTQGGNRLRVEIPDIEDADTAIEDIGKTALLEFLDEDQNVVATGADVIDASYEEYSDMEGTTQVRKHGVSVTFNKEGQQRFSDATANSIGRRIFIVLDGEVISAPYVNQRIPGPTCSITGDFTIESADFLATLIKSGALPVPLKVMEMNKIGAQLGSDAFEGSIKAGIAGTALVLLFMLVFYRFLGFTAGLALIFFIVTELLILSLFRITLTLPGIAGIILTIGMAVDANVVIFERIKDELKLKKTLRTSIQTGFQRALPAILDGNITTLIAAFVLFVLGSGPVKGFAQTLIIGVIVSVFTALFITKMLIVAFCKIGVKSKRLYCVAEEAK